MMRGRACVHADETRRQRPKIVKHLGTTQSHLNDRVAFRVRGVHLEDVLGDIETDDTDLHEDSS